MTFSKRWMMVRFPVLLAATLLFALPDFVAAQIAMATNRMAIQGYVIDAELNPETHHLAATAVVTFTAPENADVVNFGFHPALKLTKVTDEGGQAAGRRSFGRWCDPGDTITRVRCQRAGGSVDLCV